MLHWQIQMTYIEAIVDALTAKPVSAIQFTVVVLEAVERRLVVMPSPNLGPGGLTLRIRLDIGAESLAAVLEKSAYLWPFPMDSFPCIDNIDSIWLLAVLRARFSVGVIDHLAPGSAAAAVWQVDTFVRSTLCDLGRNRRSFQGGCSCSLKESRGDEGDEWLFEEHLDSMWE